MKQNGEYLFFYTVYSGKKNTILRLWLQGSKEL